MTEEEILIEQQKIKNKIFEHKNAIKSLRGDLYDLILELQTMKNNPKN